MITLKRNQTLDECLDVIIESAHSRFPVISEDKDHIEGILMAKDLLPFMRSDAEAFSMDKVLRQAVVVPESKRRRPDAERVSLSALPHGDRY
ncbi:magnesium and cobalt efflux protein [Escherichia coli]|nr:magnesium and cobalt efflux protein [Escherichia coli]